MGSSDMNSWFKPNATELGKLESFFRDASRDPLLFLGTAEIKGGASIDGSFALNEKLSAERAHALLEILDERFDISEKIPLRVVAIEEDWEGLEKQVRETPATLFPQKDQVLRMLREVSDAEQREHLLRRMDDGRVWNFLKEEVFPQLRLSTLTIVYDKARVQAYLDELAREKAEAEREAEAKLQAEARRRQAMEAARLAEQEEAARQVLLLAVQKKIRPRLAVKTDLLTLIGITTEPNYRSPMINLELEWFFSPRFSLAGSALFNSFSHADEYDKWCVTSYTLEPRWRVLPLDGFDGLYLGLYGRVGDYKYFKEPRDFEDISHTGRYQEVGLSVGYTYTVKQWLFEAGTSGGYRHVGGKEYIYVPATNRNHFLGRQNRNKVAWTSLFLRVGYQFQW